MAASNKLKTSKQKRLPALPGDIDTRKIPHWLGPPNLEKQHISWRFSKADSGGPYHCLSFSLSDFQQLWDRLRAFERMNSDELKRTGSLHDIPVIEMSDEAKERLKELKLDDLDVLYSFHIDGPCRMWCMKYQNIFSVLWWDRNHGGYLVGKKHT